MKLRKQFYGLILVIFIVSISVIFRTNNKSIPITSDYSDILNKNIVNSDRIETYKKEDKMDIELKDNDTKMESVLNKFPDFKQILKFNTKIKVPVDDNMIPQGITKVGNEYLIITAYHYKENKNSLCYVYNYLGNLINVAELDTNSHVGSIVYDEMYNILWIPKNNGNLSAYDVSDIISKKTVISKYSFDNLGSGLEDYLNSSKDAIDYLDRDDSYLYIGNFSLNGLGIIKKYEIIKNKSDFNLKFINQFKVPPRIQGVDFYTHNNVKYMILSQSYGRNLPSNLIIYRYDEKVTDYTEQKIQKVIFNLPPMLEQITVSNDEVYILFESSARKYSADCKAKVETVCVLDLLKILNNTK